MMRASTLSVTIAGVLVAAFYIWTALSDRISWRFGKEQTDYYNLLVDGFRQGKLSLAADVPPELLNSPDPYDPDVRPPGVALHDATLFRGKYYIYFGAVPAVLTLFPFRVVAGFDLPIGVAVLFFVLTGYSLQLLLLTEIRARLFPRVGAIAASIIGAVMGLASCAPILLRRSSMYDLPISSGFCFATAAAWCLYRAIFDPTRRITWIALCSLCWGLAIGSRPIYLLAPGCLGFACLYFLFRGREVVKPERHRARLILAAVVPIAVIGGLLAFYNYARFGDPTEFGVRYILSGVYESKVDHFSWRYIPWNFHAYFLSTAEWGRYFPFRFDAPIPGPRPDQHFGMDVSFGLLVHVPFLWLLGGVVLAWGKRNDRGLLEWRLFLVSLGWIVAAVSAFLLSFYAAMARYMADFAPTLALLAAIGALAVLAWAEIHSKSAARLVVVVLSLVGAVSVFTVFVASTSIYGRLRQFNPDGFQALARIANGPVHWLETLGGESFGPITLRLVFPHEKASGDEELLSTGFTDRDRVIVSYLDRGHIQIGFEHAGGGVVRSEPIAIDRAHEYDVQIFLGSLFPTSSHPFYTGWPEAWKNALLRRLTVKIEGRTALDQYQRFHDASPATIRICNPKTGQPFSGRIVRVTREGLTEAKAAAQRLVLKDRDRARIRPDANGTLRLRVRFPVSPPGTRLPLVVSGESGRGDLLLIEYLDGGRIRFLLDHWGRRPYLGPVILYSPDREYRMQITHPYYARDGARRSKAGDGTLTVTLDGEQVWEFEPLIFPMEPDDIFVGFNPIGGSTVTGSLLDVVADSADPALAAERDFRR